jgi:hypothetical protein
VEVNSTGGQGSRRAVAPSDDDGSLNNFKTMKECSLEEPQKA